MKIILIGIQGAGKSTQGNMMSKALNIPYLSSGHIFREMAKRKNKMGRWLKETLNAGALVPDDTAVEIVIEYLAKPEYQDGYILDGFPRTKAQAEVLNGVVDLVFLIDVSDKEALWRISGRVSDREDETLRAIRKRIALFHELTSEVLNYYEGAGKLVKINGEQSIEDVFTDIMTATKARQVKINQVTK